MSKLTSVQHVAISDYNYSLPEERIAKHPLEDRSACKLLFLKEHTIEDYHFSDLPQLLSGETLLCLLYTSPSPRD